MQPIGLIVSGWQCSNNVNCYLSATTV